MKHFIIFLGSFLFLVSCGQMIQEDEKNDEQTYTQKSTVGTNQEDGDTENRTSLDRGQPIFVDIGVGQMLGELSRTCLNGSDKIKYFINTNPSTIDDEGTERERERICELSSESKGVSQVLKYAHWERDFCEKELVKIVNKHIAEGWDCSGI